MLLFAYGILMAMITMFSFVIEEISEVAYPKSMACKHSTT